MAFHKRTLITGGIIGLMVVLSLGVWFSGRGIHRNEVIRVSDDLSLEVLKVLKAGEKFEVKEEMPFRFRVLKFVPDGIVKFLFTHGYISADFLTPTRSMNQGPWTNNSPGELLYVTRILPSETMEKEILSGRGRAAIERQLIEPYDDSSSGSRLILKSPDNRILQRVRWGWSGGVSKTTVGAKTTIDYSPYLTFTARPLYARYPEMEWVLLSRRKGDVYTTETMKFANPYYRVLPPKSNAKEAPFEMTTAGVTLRVKQLWADAAGSNDWLNYGKPCYRANMEAGEQSCTAIVVGLLEDGVVTDKWDLSSVRYYDDKGMEAGNGGWWGRSGEVLYYAKDINILALADAVDVKIRVKRAKDFPDDEITTISFALPSKGTFELLDQAIPFWNGDSKLLAFSNQAEEHMKWNFQRNMLCLTLTSAGMDPGIIVTEAYLESTTGTQKLSSSSQGGSPDKYSHQFRLEKPWDMVLHRQGGPIDVSEYTTFTVGLASPRYMDYNCVVKPTKATEPYKGEEYRNVFAWRD